MIERIIIENFKSLRNVDLTFGRVNLFVGINASGKSNFLEVLRVLEGIGNGFTIGEILNGKSRSATNAAWEGVRGGKEYACFSYADSIGKVGIKAYGKLERHSSSRPSFPKWEYRIAFSSKNFDVIDENIEMEGIPSYSIEDGFPARDDSSLPILGMFDGTVREISQVLPDGYVVGVSPDLLAKSFSNSQSIAPEPNILRGYSRSDRTRRMGDNGENFASLIKSICQDEKTKDAYLSWLRHFQPEEVDNVGTLSGAVDEPMFMLRENGRDFPAPVLSDGTLRFAALAAAFFQPDMPDIMTVEEIENGLHASRIQLLLELFRTQAEVTKTQVFATTHSPVILDWLQEENYKTTFLCTRDKSTGESRIQPVADIPHLMDVIKETPASELLSEGWFEALP